MKKIPCKKFEQKLKIMEIMILLSVLNELIALCPLYIALHSTPKLKLLLIINVIVLN